ncbi:hypothetical protein BGZ50_002197 [Haplosporangium sp. Z 11]|nr:hypothetical protein BGZ50_002197 [Haplosporangium sp. Z 11]
MLDASKSIELSSIEFKRPDISSKVITVQRRKNMRLGRCLQQAHESFGCKGTSVIMGDISGFMGVSYQIKPMQETLVVGKTTASLVYLPTTAGEMESFLEGTSLAMTWNFDFLEGQGSTLARAKKRH